MSKPREVVRVLGCQGTIQLVMGVAAMKLHQEKVHSNRPVTFTNILVVHSLYAPDNQEPFFFEIIKRMAESVLAWKKIILLTASTVNELDRRVTTSGTSRLKKELHDLTGSTQADELFLSREWQTGNRILMTTYSNAFKVCFGDAIGLYFKENYFGSAPLKPTGIARLMYKLRHWRYLVKTYPTRRPLFGHYTEKGFDRGYFVYPGISGVLPRFPYELIDRRFLVDIFEHFAQVFPSDIPGSVDWENGQLTFLLTSNFSEAGRATIDNELELYRQVVVSTTSGTSGWLIIKPHPRDDDRKLRRIAELFTSIGYRVWLMNDNKYFYTPFEFFLLSLKSRYGDVLKKASIVCTSSACLGIYVITGLKPVVAFGDALVRKYFAEEQKELRVHHEADLRRALKGAG